MAQPSAIRQNFSLESESGINKQINLQLVGSYVYLAMAYHFDKTEVALPGFHSYCKKLSDRKRDVAMKFMAYQNQRGGRICLQDIKFVTQDLSTSQKALETALQLEKEVNKSLNELFDVSVKTGDTQFGHTINEYQDEQTRRIKELGDHISNLVRAGPNLGEYVFDKESLSS